MTNPKDVLEWMEWKDKREREMTNEEWFCGLSTEEKAEFMGDIWGRGYLTSHFEGNLEFGEKQDKAYWEKWLKEKHGND